MRTCFQCHKLMTWGSFFKHTALRRDIKLICIPSHQHFQTSPWTFTLDLKYGPLMLLPFYMNQWLYDQESCFPSGLVYSDMPHIRDVQISLIRTHNIPLNQLMFVWSSFFCSRLCFLPKSLREGWRYAEFPVLSGRWRETPQGTEASVLPSFPCFTSPSPPQGKIAMIYVLWRWLHCVPLPIRHWL